MFEWDAGNRGHIPPERGIALEDCEQVFVDPRAMIRDARIHGGEQRWVIVGSTTAGRIIVVIYTRRGDRLRVVTAYPASGRPEERAYRRQSW